MKLMAYTYRLVEFCYNVYSVSSTIINVCEFNKYTVRNSVSIWYTAKKVSILMTGQASISIDSIIIALWKKIPI